MRVAAVVVAHNSGESLGRLLESLGRQSQPPEEIVVVEHSPGPAARTVAERHGARHLHNPQNPGYGAGCNQGVAATTAEAILLLNADMVLDAGAVAALAGALASDESLAAVSAFIVNDGEEPEEGGGALNPFGTTVPGWHQDKTATFYASGGACMARRSAWEGVGGMDESLFLYGEDVNLGWRWRLAGWGIKREPAAVARHEGQGSVASLPPARVRFLQERNRLVNYKCLNSWHTRWGYWPWMVAHEVGRLATRCLRGWAPAQLKAWLHVAFSWRHMAGKARAWRAGAKVPDSQIQRHFASQWGKQPTRADGLLAWGQDRVVRPLRGWARWGWLLVLPWWLGALLSGGGMWPDEVFTMRLAAMPLAGAWSALVADVHPPAYFLAQWLFGRLSPGTEAGAVWLPVLCAWGAGRVLARSPRPAVRAAGGWLWLLPFTFFLGTHLRYYAMAAFLMAWLARLGSHVRACPVRRFAGALLCYTTHLGPPALLLAVLLAPRRARPHAWRDALVSLLWWVPGLALLAYQAQQLEGGRLAGTALDGVAKALYTAYTLPVGHYTWDPITPIVLFTLGAALLAAAGLSARAKWLAFVYKGAILVFAFALTWGILIGTPFVPTRLSFLVVPLALLLGEQWVKARGSRLRPVAGLLLLAAFLPGHEATFFGSGGFHCGYEGLARRARNIDSNMGAVWLVAEREYGSRLVHTLPMEGGWVPPAPGEPVFLVKEIRPDSEAVWGPTERALADLGYEEANSGLVGERPTSHRWLLDKIDRLRGQEPQPACWEWVAYEVPAGE